MVPVRRKGQVGGRGAKKGDKGRGDVNPAKPREGVGTVEREEAACWGKVAEGIKKGGEQGGEEGGSTEIGGNGGRGLRTAIQGGGGSKVEVAEKAEGGRWKRAEEGVKEGVEEGGPGRRTQAGEVAIDQDERVPGPRDAKRLDSARGVRGVGGRNWDGGEEDGGQTIIGGRGGFGIGRPKDAERGDMEGISRLLEPETELRRGHTSPEAARRPVRPCLLDANDV